jgi:uncharacterized protein YcfJ
MQPTAAGRRYAPDIDRSKELPMRNLLMALGAASLVLPAAVVVPTTGVSAQGRHHQSRAREWRGRDGRTYCRRSDGTTGLIVGGIAGGLFGNAITNGGSQTLGTLLGAAGGAALGSSIDRGNVRCR